METTIFIGILVAVAGIGWILLAAPKRKNEEADKSPIINIMMVIIFILIAAALFDASPILPGSMFESLLPSTQATISRITYGKDSGGDYYIVSYTYSVNGEDYRGSSTYQLTDEIPQVGQKIRVYYFGVYPSYTSRSSTHFLMITTFGLIVLTVLLAMVLNLIVGNPKHPKEK